MDTESSEKIIRNTYLKILRRESDKIGLDHYLNLFQNGTLDEEKLVALMKNSEEYKPLQSVNLFIKKHDLLFKNENKKQYLQELNKLGQPGKLNANFFWYGENFGFLNNLVIKSHFKVGHNPKIWLLGNKPTNQYWKDIENKITLVELDDYIDVKEWLEFGGDIRMAFSIWLFHFLHACGGLCCDTDHFALKKFPDDEWILSSAERDITTISLGVIKTPPNDDLFLECIENTKYDWGALEVFTDAYKKKYGHTKLTHPSNLFYPYKWYEWNTLFENIEIPNAYSLHFYQKALEDHLKEEFKNINKDWCEKNQNTLLGRLYSWVNNKK